MWGHTGVDEVECVVKVVLIDVREDVDLLCMHLLVHAEQDEEEAAPLPLHEA